MRPVGSALFFSSSPDIKTLFSFITDMRHKINWSEKSVLASLIFDGKGKSMPTEWCILMLALALIINIGLAF